MYLLREPEGKIENIFVQAGGLDPGNTEAMNPWETSWLLYRIRDEEEFGQFTLAPGLSLS